MLQKYVMEGTDQCGVMCTTDDVVMTIYHEPHMFCMDCMYKNSESQAESQIRGLIMSSVTRLIDTLTLTDRKD